MSTSTSVLRGLQSLALSQTAQIFQDTVSFFYLSENGMRAQRYALQREVVQGGPRQQEAGEAQEQREEPEASEENQNQGEQVAEGAQGS